MSSITARTEARDLTFEQRVKAQEAIERVYYSHQMGASLPFEKAVPRPVLERKVRTYLKETVALEQFWHTRVTAEMLQRETDRMIRQTRMADRLHELFGALGNDPFLIEECLARPVLVDRLAHDFFAPDRTVPRGEASRDETWERWWQRVGPGLEDGSVRAVANDDVRALDLDALPVTGSAPSCLTDDSWLNSSLNSVPEGRSLPSAVWTGSVMVVWGGVRAPYVDWINGGRYDPATNSWASMSIVNAPAPRDGHTAVWTGSAMVVWGGTTRIGNYNTPEPDTATGGRYDPNTDTWLPTSTVNAPLAREAHKAVWTGSRMIVWGGLNCTPNVGCGSLDSGGKYDPATDTWSATSPIDAPSARYGHTAVWTGTEMIVWGGSTLGGGYLDTGARYNPVTDTWIFTAASGAVFARGDHSAVWTGSEMIVWGGTNGIKLNNGGRYNPFLNRWSPTSTVNAPEARSGHAAIWTGSLMVVWGGTYNLTSGGRYDPASDTWSPTSTVNVPGWRSGFSSVWTGSLMIVWGGGNLSDNYLNSGGRYDPVADSWTPTAVSAGPQERIYEAAVWTGNQMIVWGGATLESPYGTLLINGGKYDPAVDSWSPTSTESAPPPRAGPSAIWSGREMIVWGGGDYSTGFNTGGRYDPILDSWLPTTLAGAPSPRGNHLAFWTGTRMLLWGGPDNSGGLYDPMTDSWTATSTVGAPPFYSDMSAAWTGQVMVVWGGRGYVDTGGRYDPVADRWLPTSTLNVPSTRALATAVWTGKEVIFWGGESSYASTPLNTGGRYDPLADTWKPMSTVNAPGPRSYHTAVWTGHEMLVWGGNRDFESGLSTGGRYDPASDSWRGMSSYGPPPRINAVGFWTGSSFLVWGGGYASGGEYCACTTIFYRDLDGDGSGGSTGTTQACAASAGYVGNNNDCDDFNAGIWGKPGEVNGFIFTDRTSLAWAPPTLPGATFDLYDVLRSRTPSDFVSKAMCLATDTPNQTAVDSSAPAVGTAFFYLVRAQDGCLDGQGPLGTASNGTALTGRTCP